MPDTVQAVLRSHRSRRALLAASHVTLLGLVACEFPYPADVPDGDAGIDARVRTQPLVENNQAADLVIGQRDFVTYDLNRPTDAHRVVGAISIGGRDGRLWIADPSWGRVLLFRPLPVTNDPGAVMALGRSNFTDTQENVAVTGFNWV